MAIRTFGRNFWRQTVERAVKTAAQLVAATFVGDGFNVLDVDNWTLPLGAALTGFVLSVVSSIATAPAGEPGDPSAVRKTTE